MWFEIIIANCHFLPGVSQDVNFCVYLCILVICVVNIQRVLDICVICLSHII